MPYMDPMGLYYIVIWGLFHKPLEGSKSNNQYSMECHVRVWHALRCHVPTGRDLNSLYFRDNFIQPEK